MSIQAYAIQLYAGANRVALIPVDARNKKQAEAAGRKIADVLLPVLRAHYAAIPLGNGMARLTVNVREMTDEQRYAWYGLCFGKDIPVP
jgi:hypothetical protein